MNHLEREIIAAFEIDRVWRHLERIVEHFGGRYSGSEDERRSAEFIASELQAIGLEPSIEEVDCWLGVPCKASLRIERPTQFDVVCSAAAGQGQRVSGEFLLIETPDEAKSVGDKIRDRVVLVPYSFTLPITAREVRERGGLGLVYGNWGRSDLDLPRIGAPQTSTYWGVPEPDFFRTREQVTVPQMHIGRKSYEKLRDMCRAEPVFVTFEATMKSFWGKVHQIVVDVRAGHADADDDYLMMSAHHDSWFPGATDNAGGVAILLEVARVLNSRRAQLRRSVRLLFVSGHENGAYATSTWYLDNHWREIQDHAVAFLVVDQSGFANAEEFAIQASEELSAFAERCVNDIAGNGAKISLARADKNADRGFFGVGVPSIYTVCAFSKAQTDEWHGNYLGYFNHSNHDTVDKIDRANLETNARIRLLEAVRLSADDILPYDFRPVLAGMRQRLEAWQAVGRFDLKPVLTLLDSLDQRVGRLHRDIGAGKHAAGLANEVLKRLARALTWINYTYGGRYLQDVAGVDVTAPLPALSALGELSNHDPGSPMDTMLRTKIRRELNKVEDALLEATKIVERTSFEAG